MVQISKTTIDELEDIIKESKKPIAVSNLMIQYSVLTTSSEYKLSEQKAMDLIRAKYTGNKGVN